MSAALKYSDAELEAMTESAFDALHGVDRDLWYRGWQLRNDPQFKIKEREKALELAEAQKELERREAALKAPPQQTPAPKVRHITRAISKEMVDAVCKKHRLTPRYTEAEFESLELAPDASDDEIVDTYKAIRDDLLLEAVKNERLRVAVPYLELSASMKITKALYRPVRRLVAHLEGRVRELEARSAITVTQSDTDPRTFEMTLANGTRSTFFIPVPLYKGVWQSPQSYQRGDMVTYKGSIWHCNALNSKATPGSNGDFQLCVQKGRDGQDLKEGKETK